jgi:hypothetical protein
MTDPFSSWSQWSSPASLRQTNQPASGGYRGPGDDFNYPNKTLPSWMPGPHDITNELEQTFGNVNQAYSTSDYQKAVDATTANLTAQTTTAANNAAAEFAGRARQAGGNAEGAGLVKAEAQVAGSSSVADEKLKAAEFVMKQREAAVGQAGQIANQLGELRNNYLSTLAGFAKSAGSSSSSTPAKSTGWSGEIPFGEGASLGITPHMFNAGTGQYSTPVSNSNPSGAWVGGFNPGG